ncbi:MAG TPA: hypothetical protein VLD18_09675 [Verrucomicrobiae bacterium]|nr:hypothetical protein [Verrucomicrobiae bacterium]
MKQPKPTPRRVSPEPTAGGSRKSGFPLLPAALFLVGVSLLVWLIADSFRTPPADQPPAPPAASAARTGTTPAIGATTSEEVKPLPPATSQKLLGNWQRTDADYAIEIRLVNPDGVADARYFNPFNQRSINVARATLLEQGGAAEFFMELRDEGYPGSTYTLQYDEATDQLVGSYFQAAVRENYAVVFQRMRSR